MKWFRISAVTLFFVTSCVIIPTGMSKVSDISVLASSPKQDFLKLYLSNSAKHPTFSEKKSSVLLKTSLEVKKMVFRIPSRPATTCLRIDPGEHPGITKIYEIDVLQALGRRLHFDAEAIFDGFIAGRDGVNLHLGDGYVEIVSTVEDPFILSKPGLITKPRPLLFLLPVVILTFFFYIFLCSIDKETLQTIFLPRRVAVSRGNIIAPLDGLRGGAAILVVADHTWPWFLGAGASGVLIFFVLSGFLLSKPYVEHPERMCSLKNFISYGSRRLQRILPMYYLYLFLTFGLAFRLYDLFLHIFFIEALGHLWAIPQEMAFYTVFPAIFLINYLLLGGKKFFIVPSILSMIFFWSRFVHIKDVNIFLYGMMNSKLPFRLDVFLVGMLCSYFFFNLHGEKKQRNIPAMTRNVLTVIALATLVLFIFFSNGYLFHNKKIYSQIYYLYYAFGAGALICILASTREKYITRFFSSTLLSSLGIVSYSFYLFHPLVISFVKHVGGIWVANGAVRFTLVVIISYLVACLLSHFIERPLLAMTGK